MKSIFGWLRNSARIKRWLFLILAGMILVCYGLSKVLVLESLVVIDLVEIVASFVVGFILFTIGIINIQKRSLELVIEANTINKDEDNSEIKIKTLVSKKNIYEKGPKIVVLGGGSGLNNILRGLRKYTSNITAIVAVTSYGQEKTNTEKVLKLKPIEDIKQSLIALSLKEEEMKQLMNYKFTDGKLQDISFGDLYVSAMENVFGGFASSIEKSSDILSIVGKVIPVSLDEMRICAELKEGTIVEEKEKIAEVVLEKITNISRVYLSPSNCRTAPGVIEAIDDAEVIIIGPGSLYTNVIPNLLIKNVSKAIKDSKAQKIYVSNIMTEPGQTDDYEVSDHIKAIIEHGGEGIIDTCICDTGEIVPEIVRRYNLAGANIVNMDTTVLKETGIRMIKADISTIENDQIRHNPDAIAKIIVELICDELKFKEKHKDEQFMLLNTKLKEENEKQKTEAKGRKKVKTVEPEKKKRGRNRRLSKFNMKYRERIKSINSSEKIRLKNVRLHEQAQQLIEEAEKREKERFLEESYKMEETNQDEKK